MTATEINSAAAALPASNGVPEGQQIGGYVDVPAGDFVMDQRVKLPTGVKLRGQGTGTRIYGTLTTNIVEFYTNGGAVYDAGVENITIQNLGAGGAVGIASESAGDCGGLRVEKAKLRALGVPLNLRNPNGNLTYNVRIQDVTVYGSRTHYVDVLGSVFNIDGLFCVNNRETQSVAPGQIVLLEGEGTIRSLWIEGQFLCPLLRARVGSQDYSGCHFEPGKGTADGVEAQIILEGAAPTNTHPALYRFDRLAFVQPTVPIKLTNKALLTCGYLSYETGAGAALAPGLRTTAIIAATGSRAIQASEAAGVQTTQRGITIIQGTRT